MSGFEEEFWTPGESVDPGSNCPMCGKDWGTDSLSAVVALVEVTDEMVHRAAVAFYQPQAGSAWVVPPQLARNMRRALEAALGKHE